MKTTIYTVTMNRVFGSIDDLHTFVCKDEAEALVVEWANKNSTEDAPKFYTADEAIDWFSENDSELEMTIDMHETEVDMASNDDYEMLASENKLMGEFLCELGYSQDEVSQIANSGLASIKSCYCLEIKASTLNQDIISIIEGIIDLTPVDPAEFTWLLKMETLTETLNDEGYEDAFKEEWTEFVKDCENSGAKYVIIDGKK